MKLIGLLASLRNKALVMVFLFGLIFWAEFLALRGKFNDLKEKQLQTELLQSAVITSHNLALQLQFFKQGHKERLGDITSLADRQDEQLQLLAKGGRIESSTDVIEPLPYLSRITLEQVEIAWANYRKSAITIATHEVWKDSVTAKAVADTTTSGETESTKVLDSKVASAITLIDGQWTSLTNKYNELLKDLEMEEAQSKQTILTAMEIVAAMNILLIVLLFYSFNRYALAPVKMLELSASARTHYTGASQDEVGKVAKQINTIIDQLNNASGFVKNIEEGNLEATYEGLDKQKEDQLALALLAMRTKLKEINEEEQKRKWANEGLARFVDILRSSDTSLNALGDKIISTLVQYTGSNQGGLYVLNDDDSHNRYLELISLFAFNTKKFEQQKLKLGESLVGQTYLEKETIYLTEIPSDYIRITSGLGETTPKAILIVPLKVDKEVYGIVELASFREYQTHEIAFVEKLGETIASTLASVKSNQSNRKLLEDAKMSAESLRSQEEEMRQNMEELTATQEEMSRKERDYILKIKELEEKLKDPARGDDWAVASEMERTLKVNLEAIRLTQEELVSRATR